MSSSTPSKLPVSAPTVLELGRRRLETARTLEASVHLAFGTNPPPGNAHVLATSPPPGVDAHLIAIGTPVAASSTDAMKIAGASIASPTSSSSPIASTSSPIASASSPIASASSIEPRTVNLNGPAFVPPARGVMLAPRTTPARRPRASIALAVFLGLFALVLAPLAPLAWMHAHEQLELMARGTCRATGKRILHAVQGIGIAMTMVAVAATAFGATVIIARALT